MAIFASYSMSNAAEYSVRLLAILSLGDEWSLNEDEHVSFMTYVLAVFKCSWNDVTALISENCARNKSIANKACNPLIGCTSHRF